ncbi:hypothetical protein AYI68_g1064 [Smittium mucronatum]|uniref:Uncharacterized protein n=1 Tax=Smittium mucronatum TaxID=133383 RepID=A0A1R0H6J2_9FUNG|nr:hypothetical protein AYI68_g1064 [Smittium mucronatum]
MDKCIEFDNRISSRYTFRYNYYQRPDYHQPKLSHSYPHHQPNKYQNVEVFLSQNQSHLPGTPMDIDTLKSRCTGPLNYEEKSRKREKLLCLYCGSDQHIVHNCKLCPQNLKAKPR